MMEMKNGEHQTILLFFPAAVRSS